MTEPDGIKLANQIGYFLRKQGKIECALRIFRSLERYQPNHMYPVLGRALTLAVQGAFAEAEIAFRRALELSPRHSFVLACLGLVCVQQHKAGWRAYFQEAMQCRDDHGGREIAQDLMTWLDGAAKPQDRMTVGSTIGRLYSST
ncbi:hypothetical protein [Burkholderia ubonensis]|uniref:hypothetical protein n=1 Tax=Burkholderia ubonensis TaxID=101571 RepID=UPI0007C7D652|nr:hypothetical protein [Burkholderia ubonensis]